MGALGSIFTSAPLNCVSMVSKPFGCAGERVVVRRFLLAAIAVVDPLTELRGLLNGTVKPVRREALPPLARIY